MDFSGKAPLFDDGEHPEVGIRLDSQELRPRLEAGADVLVAGLGHSARMGVTQTYELAPHRTLELDFDTCRCPPGYRPVNQVAVGKLAHRETHFIGRQFAHARHVLTSCDLPAPGGRGVASTTQAGGVAVWTPGRVTSHCVIQRRNRFSWRTAFLVGRVPNDTV